MALHQVSEKLDSLAHADTKASSDDEKNYPEHHEDFGPGGHDPILDSYSEAEVKRIVHRVDLRLVPICGLMYCVSLLDRTNLSNAAIAG